MLVPNTPRKQHCFEIVVLQLKFDYLFVGIIGANLLMLHCYFLELGV